MNKNIMIVIVIMIICIISLGINIYSLFFKKREKYTYMNYGGYRLGSVSSIVTPFMFLIKNNGEDWNKRKNTKDCDYDCKDKTML